MPAFTQRATGLALAVGTFTAAMSFACVGTAQADDGCAKIGIEHSLDGGQTWITAGRMDGEKVPTVVDVRLSEPAADGCDYAVSLASYSAEGPDWGSSGTQAFLGWDTVTLNTGKTQATLSVSDHAPDCYGQIDLYGNGTEYDGGSEAGHGPLPHYDNSWTPNDLITAWNGGHKCDTTTPPTTAPTPTATTTTDTPTPTATTSSGTPTPTATTTTGTPTPTATTTAPAVGDTSSPAPSSGTTKQPTGTPSVPPAASGSGSNLAETGGNGTQTTAFTVGGAVLLIGGGAAVYFTRRRHSGAH